MKKVTVIRNFRDKNDRKTVYQPEQVISNLENFPDERLANLEKRGLVKVEEIETAFGAIDLSASAEDIKKVLAEVTDIDLVTGALASERLVKNRSGVQALLENKIQELQEIENGEIENIGKIEDVEELKGLLGTENEADKPRQRIVEAIKTRIVELA